MVGWNDCNLNFLWLWKNGFLMRSVASLLFGISTHDPETFAGVAMVLILVAFFACYVPARRATKINPVVALRNE